MVNLTKSLMRFDVVTIFPDLLASPLQEGIISRAVNSGKVIINCHNLRDYTVDKHNTTDDRPFGGGEGMVMKPEPIVASLRDIEAQKPGGRIILMSPQGRKYTQAIAHELAEYDHLILLCGRYEGVDERIHRHYIHEEISIGDYVLTGGELAAMVLIDSITRLLPGVLGCDGSAAHDAFSRGMLKHPQFTRPRDFESHVIPDILLSGDHAAVERWRFVEAVKNTLLKRPSLLREISFSREEMRLLHKNGVDISTLPQ